MKNAAKVEHLLKDHLSDAEQTVQYMTACYEDTEVAARWLARIVNALLKRKWASPADARERPPTEKSQSAGKVAP